MLGRFTHFWQLGNLGKLGNRDGDGSLIYDASRWGILVLVQPIQLNILNMNQSYLSISYVYRHTGIQVT